MIEPQKVRDLGMHAAHRIDRVMSDIFDILETSDEVDAVTVVLSEYFLRKCSVVVLSDLPACADLNTHEKVMVFASLLAKLTAYTFEEKTIGLNRLDVSKIATATGALTAHLKHLGMIDR